MNFLQNHGSGKTRENKWGLVLSGGGTRGAYEVGAWQAVRELRIPIRGIAGTSIGALNAAMFTCLRPKQIEEIYSNIRLSDVLPVSGSIDEEKNVFDPVNLLAIVREYFSQRGLDNAPLRNMLLKYLKIDKIYASPLDLGIVSYNVKTRQPLRVFKEDVEKSSLIDYLLASANFPIYKTQNVDGKRFMDGGLYDNMPFNLLIERGYSHLIVIDINGIGMTRKVERSNDVLIRMVSCSENLGGTFDFNHERINRNMKLGYLDTMKAFHKLFGNHFFFRRPAFNDLLLNFDLDTIKGLEIAGQIYKIDRYRIYEAEEFLTELERRYAEKEQEYFRNAQEEGSRTDLKEMHRMLLEGGSVHSLVHTFMEQPLSRTGMLAKAFPDLAAAANAIIELKNYRRMQL